MPSVSSRGNSATLSAPLGTIDLLAERKQAGVIGRCLAAGAFNPAGGTRRFRRRHLRSKVP